MAKSITLYNVFVASPSDVQAERDCLSDIIKEINLTTANNLGVKLELLRWETHTYPSFGKDSQDVISKQINDDYDIFIGIMWSKFGTPTGRAESGTKEEFLNAYEKWKTSDGKELVIMFYFKNAPILPENIDPEQITFLKNFKAELGDKGGLYSQFNDLEEFKQFVRIHLNKALTDLVNANKNNVIRSAKVGDAQITIIEDEEIEEVGLLESIEISYIKFLECTDVMDNMTRYLQDLTDKMDERTRALNRLTGASDSVKLRESKRIMDKTAEDFMNFVNRTKVEIPIFKSLYQSAFSAFSYSFSVWKVSDLGSKDLENVRNSISTLKISISGTVVNTLEFRNQISSFPNMTSSLTKARNKTIEVLDSLVKEFQFALQLIEEFERND